MNYDILVVGAGPAGLAFATALASTGWRIALIDPLREAELQDPPEDGREIALTQQSVRTLQHLGLWARIAPEHRAPLRRACIFDGPDPQPLVVDARSCGANELGFLVSNHHIRRAAFATCASARGGQPAGDFYFEDRVVQAQVEPDAAHLTLASGRQLQGRLLIAADSRFSSTRRMLGIAATHRDFGRSMLVCAMTHERDHAQSAWEWFDHGQTLALLPMNPDPETGRPRASVVITLPAADIEALCHETSEAFNQAVAARFAHRLGAMQLQGQRHVYPLVAVWPERIAAPRFACIGDAAVGMHPVTAHGFNFGLLGVSTLASRLRRAAAQQADPGAYEPLAAYERRHRRDTRSLYLTTQAIVGLYTDERPAARTLRRLALRAAAAFPPFQHRIARALTA